MRLDQEMVIRKICDSRTEAQELIASGYVNVNNQVCTKQTRQIHQGDIIFTTSSRKFVSRGGEKLSGALTHIFGNDDAIRKFCENKHAIDIGASTGGFTDCLLHYGVTRVVAVDVGTAQLHHRIKEDKRVISFENTDIRNFTPNETYQIIVADLSFISLEHVFESIIKFGRSSSLFFLLIKPQFEVGKGNTKKGIVTNQDLVEEIVTKYKNLATKHNLHKISLFACSIQGGDGNQEYFLYGELL